jgi:hypothetical protein
MEVAMLIIMIVMIMMIDGRGNSIGAWTIAYYKRALLLVVIIMI